MISRWPASTLFATLLFLNGAAFAQTWTEEQKITSSDAAADDNFGVAVSVDGDTAVIGADFDDLTGSAYVITRNGTTWTEEQKLIAGSAAAGDRYGVTVSVNGDTAVVGAPLNDTGGIDAGAAYVFVRNGTTWTEQQMLIASDIAPGDLFGARVSVDGDSLLIASSGNDAAGTDSGASYIFVRNGTVWTEQQKINASDAAPGDAFGNAVSLSGDTALIGAYANDDAGSNSGSAYVFVFDGTNWQEEQKLVASDAATNDIFGWFVSLSGDTAVIGSPLDDDNGSDAGSAYVFFRVGTNWQEEQKLTASDAASGDSFGTSASVSGDTTVVGAYTEDAVGNDSGSAYVFVRSGVTWQEEEKLIASDAAAVDNFAISASISGDTAVIGSFFDDDAGSKSGSAYVFVVSAATKIALLRTAATALNPVTPALATLLPLAMPRDLYIADFISGELDATPGTQPLLFYGLDVPGVISLVETALGEIQITF